MAQRLILGTALGAQDGLQAALAERGLGSHILLTARTTGYSWAMVEVELNGGAAAPRERDFAGCWEVEPAFVDGLICRLAEGNAR